MKVKAACRWTGMTRQNYYAQRKQRKKRQVEGQLVVALVLEERREQPRLGCRKLLHILTPQLEKAGVKVGRDQFIDLMRDKGLLVEKKRSQWPKTTSFNQNLPVYKNEVKHRVVTRINEVWVTDITYIRVAERFMYLGLITDKWSRKIVGYHLAETLESSESIKALNQALKGLPKDGSQKPIHHSDRGCQYASHRYVAAVEKAGLKMSMTENDHAAENALAERMNGILKGEYYLDAKFATAQEARSAVDKAVKLYNERRPHTALGYETPERIHAQDN